MTLMHYWYRIQDLTILQEYHNWHMKLNKELMKDYENANKTHTEEYKEYSKNYLIHLYWYKYAGKLISTIIC